MLFGKHIDANILLISNSFASFSGYLYIISGSNAGNKEHSSCSQSDKSSSELSIILLLFLENEDMKKALQNELVFVSDFIGILFSRNIYSITSLLFLFNV